MTTQLKYVVGLKQTISRYAYYELEWQKEVRSYLIIKDAEKCQFGSIHLATRFSSEVEAQEGVLCLPYSIWPINESSVVEHLGESFHVLWYID